MNCSYYHKDAYFLGLKILSVLETTVMFLAIYCIIFESPKSMKTFRWLLLNQQVWILILQIVLGGLIQPVLYIPASGGRVHGLLSGIISPSTQYYIAFFIIGCVVASTVALFEYRYQAILPNNSILKLSNKTRTIMFIALPCLPDEALSIKYTVFVEPMNFKFVIVFLVLAGVPSFVEAAFYVLGSFRRLNPFINRGYSDKTRQLQWSFLKALMIQEAVPILLTYPGPIIYFIFSAYTRYINTDLNNLAVLILMSHGMFSGLAVILVNKPYREFFCRIFQTNIVSGKNNLFIDSPQMNILSFTIS
ncbi:unnamed protein product [Caenorhabditis auriculariae]|uniref:Serpentine Receptor, class H n=1 Tax=Caenorhabditis auriculariae TaxID=2777116 RepID=A0A8S1HR72_9PELO|nr:unnamed protein product [Caenorhabditis auriculariae]